MLVRIIKKQEDIQLIQHFYTKFTRKFDDRITVGRLTNQSRNGCSNSFFDASSFLAMKSQENDSLSDDEFAVQRDYATPNVLLTLLFEPKPGISLSELFEDIRTFLCTEFNLNNDEYVVDSSEPPSNSSFIALN